VLKIEPARSADHVTGWLDSDGRVISHWRLPKNEDIPSQPFSLERLISTYPDVPQESSTAQESEGL
jgi:hypothetical protein